MPTKFGSLRRAAAGILILAGTLAPLQGAATGSSLRSRLASSPASEQRLRAQIASENSRLGALGGSIAHVTRRLGAIQADLNVKQARLAQLQGSLRRERAHLVRLQVQLARADRALSNNLRSQFENDPPDAITVILRSHGFADMMDRLEFVRRAKQHDQRVIGADRAARRIVIAAATRLGALEARAQTLTDQVRGQRDAADRIRLALVDRRIKIERARSAHASTLAAAERRRRALQAHLARRSRASSGVPGGRVMSGGGFTFPMPGGAASPPGSWSNDQGVDISAAGGTPLLAVGSGTIVLHGIGGFGAWAPVLHLDSGRYVYYGHAGPGNAVSIGTHVGAGQVISEVGSGIVGISTGPHLEIGFADANGAPSGRGTASEMHALLLAAYHG